MSFTCEVLPIIIILALAWYIMLPKTRSSCGAFGACAIQQQPQQNEAPKESLVSVELSPMRAAQATDAIGVAQTPNMFSSGEIGSPYDNSAFALSETSSEFYKVNPTSLSTLMPAGWRPELQNEVAVKDSSYTEFSRFTVSPTAAQKAEGLRGVIRLSELSSRNSRTLGAPSLLRNFVTPTQPIPIGSKAFIFNDSSMRQGYIAAATGSYPTQLGC